MDKIADFLNITYNNVIPKKGKVLVSQPFLFDGCFKRSVVLLTEYSKSGAIGFVLNKLLDITVKDMVDDFPVDECYLSVGGPLSTQNLHYLHTAGNIPDAIEIVNGIYWGGDIDVIRNYLSLEIIKPEQIRFFLGYSGWSQGQLDKELENNSWLVGSISPSHIINPIQHMWRETVRSMGDEYKIWASFPENPILN